MGGTLKGPELRAERTALATRLSTPLPTQAASPAPGTLAHGLCCIPMLLTWLSHWGGAMGDCCSTGI